MRRKGGGTGGSADQGISCRSTAASVSETVSPAKSWRPVSISNTMIPNAQMSAR